MPSGERSNDPLRLLFVSAEAAPFAKTGGLGDVVGALPRYLARLGHDVRVVVPLYRRVLEYASARGVTLERLGGELSVELGYRRVRFSIVEARLPDTDPPVPIYFVSCPSLYDRPGIYSSASDEHLRFVLLQWAALKLCQALRFAPDVVHAHDWHTSLLPLLVKTAFAWDRLFQRTKSVLTIHNIGHQGSFPAERLADTGLAEVRQHFHQGDLDAGRINFLLTGILYADAITTVSPTYAREIRTAEHGVGMDPFLRDRGPAVVGILNGIDEDVWDPARDTLIPHRFDADHVERKELNKRALLDAMGMPYHPRAPLFGVVSRMVWQKGLDLAMEVLPALFARHDAQLVALGSGEAKYEQFFAELARRYPHKVALRTQFSEPLAHVIEAASDFFLMPSRYEPCGLNQMYSLRYGALPIVHATGGLADTVELVSSRDARRGNGIRFEHFDAGALAWALSWALDLWGTGDGPDRAAFRDIQRRAMREDHGWSSRVAEYERVYRFVVG